MLIGDRLRALREAKHLSQGDIEKRTGLLRSYVSRVENGHTVPAVETLRKWACALEIPLYQLFYEGRESPPLPSPPKPRTAGEIVPGASRKEARVFERFRRLLERMSDSDRRLLMQTAVKLARR